MFNYNLNLALLELPLDTKKPIDFLLFNKNFYHCNFAILRKA